MSKSARERIFARLQAVDTQPLESGPGVADLPVNALSQSEKIEKLKSLMEAMYDVYEFDPLIIINMFHLQSSETLKNLSSPLLENITELSRNSLAILSEIFKDDSGKDIFTSHHPTEIADIVWSLFTGVVLWEESKRMIDNEKDFLKQTLDVAFEIFTRGITR